MEKKYVLPKILIISVPKSGTNLLIQLLDGVPGMNQGDTTTYHIGNYKRVLNAASPGKFIYGHIPYDQEFSKELDNHAIKKIFIYRDLRDVIVSLLYFIKKKHRRHPLYSLFQDHITDHKEQLLTIINGVEFSKGKQIIKQPGIYEIYKKIYDWRCDPSVCSVRFENLRSSQRSRRQSLLKIIDYLFPDMTYQQKEKLHGAMLKNIHPKMSWTFRKGNIGDWRKEFDERHIEAFKRVTGDFLIKLGYEKDADW